MIGIARTVLLTGLFFMSVFSAHADHIIVNGGPALRKWENLRVP